jgi:hypothetical protein
MRRYRIGTVTACPNAERMVAVGFGAGPAPVVVTDTLQRAPVPIGVRTALPRLSGPAVVVTVTVSVLPVPREVVPARSQV